MYHVGLCTKVIILKFSHCVCSMEICSHAWCIQEFVCAWWTDLIKTFSEHLFSQTIFIISYQRSPLCFIHFFLFLSFPARFYTRLSTFLFFLPLPYIFPFHSFPLNLLSSLYLFNSSHSSFPVSPRLRLS